MGRFARFSGLTDSVARPEMARMTALGDNGAAADLAALWNEGAHHLRDQRPAEALIAFERLAKAEPNSATVWMGVGVAHSRLGDGEQCLAALRRALELEPRNAQALLLSADQYRQAGDSRAASAFYDAVIKVAEGPDGVDPAFQPELARARRMRDQLAETYRGHLLAELDGAALEGPQARRVRRALDLLTGKSRLYLQEPEGFYFPELPNIGYAEREDFPWLAPIEAATEQIRDELLKVLEDEGAFAPYVQPEADRPTFDDRGLLGSPSWTAFHLIKAGEVVAQNAARCPATLAALAHAPLCRIPGRTPTVLFSLLQPGAHIPPHHGFTNARFICHLPLIVPEACAMRVGAETRAWTEGEACVFDDSVEHEAWNRNADRLRVVLIFDVWRPELTEAERVLVADLLQAVDRFGRLPDGD
jgi:aspartyl/asparaginyl beta-hydroxylase (cupin superfamily)